MKEKLMDSRADAGVPKRLSDLSDAGLLNRIDKNPSTMLPNSTRKLLNLSHETEEEAFDAAGFLKLLGDVVCHERTGVVSARIHVRDGILWAASVQFDNAEDRAA
jgi:hypothetical protein